MNFKKLFLPLFVTCLLIAGFTLAAGCGTSAPSISSIAPSSGVAGASFTVSGSCFGTTQSAGSVLFGAVRASITRWSDTRISARVPSSLKAGKFRVTVTTDGGTSNAVGFEVKSVEKKQAATGAAPDVVIVEYYKARGNNLKTSAGTAVPKLFKQSKTDSNWELWYVAWGQGTDADTLLLHGNNGQWQVVVSSRDSLESTPKLNPQSNGAPADLTWQGWPP